MDLAALQRELARRAIGADTAPASPAGLPLDQVQAFARSLARKRAAEVRRLLPLTSQALGSEFARKFESYAAGQSPAGAKRHAVDAVGFARHLEGCGSTWIADLAGYEAAWVEMELGRQLLLRSFSEVVDGQKVARPTKTWMLWIRPPWNPVVRAFRLWPPYLTRESRAAEKKDGAQERT